MSVHELADPRVSPPAYAIGVDPMTINELDAMYDPSVWATVIALRDHMLGEIEELRGEIEVLRYEISDMETALAWKETEYE